MSRNPKNPGAWPRWMCAATAAGYVDERSVEAFLRKAGSVYPAASCGKGRTAKWDKEEIDQVMNARKGTPMTVLDAANVL